MGKTFAPMRTSAPQYYISLQISCSMRCCIVLDITKGTQCRCSSGYNISKYPQDSVVVPAVSLDRLNTQVAEQTNSVLERIRTQVIFLLHVPSEMQP